MVIIINPVLEEYELTRKYFGKNSYYMLGDLKCSLKPKPDTPGWRDLFRVSNITPIESCGNIFPSWALLDLYKLMALVPGIERKLLPNGMNLENLPSLDHVLDSMGFQKIKEGIIL